MSKQSTQWAKDNPEALKIIQARYDAKRRTPERLQYKRNSIMFNKYGITRDEYDAMRSEQNYSCKICNIHENEAPATRGRQQKLVIDHCHTTKEVRGLLCVKCNVGIGMFDDNEDRLISAISYLKGSK